jgi:hypothetical protein
VLTVVLLPASPAAAVKVRSIHGSSASMTPGRPRCRRALSGRCGSGTPG